MTICAFPGSFDPVTRGHLDLIRRASALFDRVLVTVMINVNKSGAIDPARREDLLRKACADLPNVTVERWDGLLADYMAARGANVLLRGVRSAADFAAEASAAAANRLLNDRFETLMMLTDPALEGVSSSAVREIAAFGGDFSAFVPEEIKEEIVSLLSKNSN